MLLLAIMPMSAFAGITENYSIDDVQRDNIETDIIVLEDFLDDVEFRESVRERLIDVFGLEFMQNQTIAIENFRAMRSYFPETRLGQIIYPTFYGGSYIDTYGNLVTLMVYGYENNTQAQHILGLAQPSISTSNVATRFVQFSFAELTEIMDIIHAFHINNPGTPVRENIGSAVLDVVNNVVVVNLWIVDSTQIDLFIDTVIDSPAIQFGQYVRVPFESDYISYIDYSYIVPNVSPRNITVNPGATITAPSGRIRSLGYRATRNSVSGFVTAAHYAGAGSVYIDQVFSIGSTEIGTVAEFNRETLDGAFLTGASGVTFTNTITGTERHGTRIFDPIRGATIVRLSHGGSTSPVFSEGEIINIDALWTYGGHSVRTVQTRGLRAVGGDSGGLVFHENLNNIQDHLVAGIVVSAEQYIRARRIGTYLGVWPR
jgi:streptogrisin B